ncbi:bifunctional glutamate N-acetyltransferase/amino-acid acetyltransferase ArgJ [Oscillochloris sp. ZM17-4]|uniref:bifunctional glutamate N-acetyltransferase/amino-acid acetyltransferase ArgJ n=1 Tax=Oscillochloris sp. ZM17-4 TaxID=2866714 RepID=UPI001C73949B|nr:bifunctional glutamate N-acetyltransferase/amino-acid acetyltransferase ArgJ [Oscillochloris sp. ZM17-4]MBX0330337.1 bifunctional glutamate N-acetyltransferase/amino-acid acetyltransferase ArgJ [Oscillochloris sp. ZM17-4]
MSYTIFEDGHISSPHGFRATGVSCGLKDGSRARDLALIYSLHPCKVAAMFTTSVTRAAPVYLSQAILSRNREAIRAVMINSGHANAGTGQAGLTDAVECAKLVADELEIQRDAVMLMSTGIIGVPLPMPKIRDGIRRAVSELDSGGGRRAAVAILTTDTKPKERVYRVQLGEGHRVTLAGMAKGTRMIHPRLATMLCMITTDLAIDQHLLAQSLSHSVGRSFNRLNLDGDCSPNDTVMILANGAAEGPPITDAGSRAFAAWQDALNQLCYELSQQIVRDASNGGKIIQVTVRGAPDEEYARKVCDVVARSSALRAACMRNTPDWGTLLAAIGSSEVELRPELLELRIGHVVLMLEGLPCAFDQAMALQLFTSPEIDFMIDMHLGPAEATVLTCTWAEE